MFFFWRPPQTRGTGAVVFGRRGKRVRRGFKSGWLQVRSPSPLPPPSPLSSSPTSVFHTARSLHLTPSIVTWSWTFFFPRGSLHNSTLSRFRAHAFFCFFPQAAEIYIIKYIFFICLKDNCFSVGGNNQVYFVLVSFFNLISNITVVWLWVDVHFPIRLNFFSSENWGILLLIGCEKRGLAHDCCYGVRPGNH